MVGWLIDSLATGGTALVMPDDLAKATTVLCLTAAIAVLLRRSAAAVRHRLWGLSPFGLDCASVAVLVGTGLASPHSPFNSGSVLLASRLEWGLSLPGLSERRVCPRRSH
jgi:hypothetical protein